MFYKYSETAGYYGNGGWIIYGVDCFGMINVTKVLSSEKECIDAGARLEGVK